MGWNILVQDRPWEWMGMHPMWWAGGAWGLGMMLMMLLFWGFLIVGLVLVVRWLLPHGRGLQEDGALQILRERYARGEINREEYEAKKRDLS